MSNKTNVKGAVIFDLDGTLSDTSGDIVFSANYIREKVGKLPLDSEAVMAMVGNGAPFLLSQLTGLEQSSGGRFKDLLDELKVPIESQVLVYSKTSLQNDRISPWKPRALYFSEEYYVGWVQGGNIEIISCDPDLGPVFYLITIPQGESAGPARIERRRDCLTCHGGSRTNNMPGSPTERGSKVSGSTTRTAMPGKA